MTIEQVREKLTQAGVNTDSLTKLAGQDMLDAEQLNDTGEDALVSIVGLTLGMAKKVKKAFPGTTPVAAPVATPVTALPTQLVVRKPGKATAEDLLNGLLAGTPDEVAAAQKKWGKKAFIVTNDDGTLDVKGTLAYLGWSATRGESDRYPNTAGTQVQLVNIDSLLNVKIECDPLTGKKMVPGDAMYALSAEQQLLVSFAVVTNKVRPGDNADLIISQVKELTSTWAQVKAQLATAKRNNTQEYQRAEARLFTTVK